MPFPRFGNTWGRRFGQPFGFPLLTAGGVSAPDAPTNLVATPFSSTRIDLTWDDNADNEDGYKIYRSTDNVAFSEIDDIAADLEAYSDTTITGGTDYYYKVEAYNSGGEAITASVGANTLTLTLISDWELDEVSAGAGAVTRNDSVGTNHLTDTGNTPSAVGKIGNAASFNGTARLLTVASNASLQTGDIDFTIAFFLKFTSAPTATASAPICKLSAFNTAGTEWRVLSNSSGLFFTLSNGASAVDALNVVPVAAGVWYCVVLWYDAAANTINNQVDNGTPVSSAFVGGAQILAGAPLRLGGSGDASRYVQGDMDLVRFWKRTLSASERTALYNGGAGKAGPFL